MKEAISYLLIMSISWWDLQDPVIDEQIEENLFHMLDEETDNEYVYCHWYLIFYFIRVYLSWFASFLLFLIFDEEVARMMRIT